MDRLLAKLDRIPIRWRLALTSAGLTAVILALFALVFGILITGQLRSSFDSRLRDTAEQLRDRIVAAGGGQATVPQELFQRIFAGDAAFRVLGPDGELLGPANAPDLGPPSEEITEVGGYRVATEPVYAGGSLLRLSFVQYGESASRLDGDIDRLRLLLILGVLGASALALLAGLAVANRAMAPIAALTQAARGVARTRDADVRLPKPVADDEVAALANTLEEMLRELDAAHRETEQALARQRQFVADASHELRTPLTSVLANLELLEAALAGEDAEIAASALRSSQRMRRLVADLLLLARADAGRHAPRRPTDLAAVLSDAAAEVAPLAAEHDLALDAEPGAVVEGAPDDLHRLALNLLENAVRHTPPGTRVRASARRDGQAVVLVVEDDGPGIPPDQRERVFDRFVRGAGDAGGGGTGLGLAIVRAVAEAHGGAVELGEGEGGRGARFVVRLPAAERAPAPDAVVGG